MSGQDQWRMPYRWSIADDQSIIRLDNPSFPEVEHQYVYRNQQMAQAWVDHLALCHGATNLRAVPVPFVQREI